MSSVGILNSPAEVNLLLVCMFAHAYVCIPSPRVGTKRTNNLHSSCKRDTIRVMTVCNFLLIIVEYVPCMALN